MQNDTDEDITVFVNVKNVEVRISDVSAPETAVFTAKILEIHDDFFLVEPTTGSWELNSADRMEVPLKNMAASPEPQVGDLIEITYSGEILETYPARLSKIYGIRVLENSGTDSLDAAISSAILDHYARDRYAGLISVESHVLLANEGMSGTLMVGEDPNIEEKIVYLLVLHETYSTYGGTLESVGGSYIPTAITFSIRDSGEYMLEEYWEPRDGSYYTDDIRDKFPGVAADDALNDQAYIEDLQTQNYSKALAYLHSAGSLDTTIEKLLDAIMASPTASSNPSDYTQAHELEYQELLSYGEYTLRYCFSEFLQGGQTELRGQIMALICQNIMLSWGEGYAIDQDPVTGQDWFDAFKRSAESLDIQYSDEDMEKYYPGSCLLLQIMNE
ncbi:MAG: hypothetical protein ACI4HQ_09735 [Acetatifactor sp.]